MNPQIISFKCILRNKAGKLISETFNHEVLTALEVEIPGVLSGLTKNLQNLKKGEKRNIHLLAEEAYGLYHPNKVILYPRKQLPREIRVGEAITIVSKSGIHNHYVVLELLSHFARLDGNHPLAGQDLIFEIETLAARDATAEEIESSAVLKQEELLH